MFVIPAIDIIDGSCVRLFRGDYSTAHKVAEDPIEAAKSFCEAGAKWLHIVDLDGAKSGRRVNADLITSLASSVDIKVEIGGGIRDMASVEYYLNNGIDRVILGSAAVNDQKFVREAIKEYNDKISIGIDAKNRMVKAEGWIADSEINYLELAKRMENIGCRTIIYTDIDQDGTLSGPNLKELDDLVHSVSCHIVASGGVSSIIDIVNLANLNVYGAICGKAIYTGNLDLKRAIQMAQKV